jgi:hypothetical protein
MVPFHTSTDWQLKPSLKYDALCLFNVLSGDPYYLHYYQAEYDRFHPLFTPEEQAAFVQLKHVLKDENGEIVSATLTLYYSTVDDETLPEMIRTAHDSSAMEAALKKTTYWSETGWKSYDQARPALEVALRALDRVGFPDYWMHSARPRVESRIAELAHDLPRYNIVPAMENLLGFALPSQTITIYLLNYSEPHGIRITGLRFLTHVSYPFRIVMHNAIHEPMHPPYSYDDPAVQRAIDLLGSDPLIADKVQNHDPSFGYNSTRGYIEEDSVQALEEIVSEQFGVGRNPCQYWQQQDGGIHVLAAAIYVGYKAALAKHPEPYSRWFTDAVTNRQIRGDGLKSTVASFFSSAECQVRSCSQCLFSSHGRFGGNPRSTSNVGPSASSNVAIIVVVYLITGVKPH